MVDITNYHNSDPAVRSRTTIVEETNYTITWANLTGAGFAGDDEIVIIYQQWLSDNTTTSEATSEFKIGTTYGTATTKITNTVTGEDTTVGISGRNVGGLWKHTLETNEQLFWSLGSDVGNGWSSNFSVIILKLGDLAADDYRWNEDATLTGDAPATPTAGATVTLPPGGGDDWLHIGCTDWLIDALTNPSNSRLQDDSGALNAIKFEGRSIDEQFSVISIGYTAAAAASEVVTTDYWDAGTNDAERAAIFSLRLEAFADHIGAQDQSGTHSLTVLDTAVEVETADLVLGTTGDVFFFAQAIADVSLATHVPYCRLTIDSTEAITDLSNDGYRAADTTDELPVQAIGRSSVTSGTKTYDLDCYEGNDVGTANTIDRSTLVAFSAALAGGTSIPVFMNHYKQQHGQN